MNVFRKRAPVPPTVVGLDLDPSHIAAADVASGDSPQIRRSAFAMLRPGILRDGELADPEALAAELADLFTAHELPTHVRVGIANQRIVVRSIDLPPLLDDEALAAAVRDRAPDHIPMPIDDAVLDYQSLGIVSTVSGPATRVLIAAVRRELVERLAASVTAAGLTMEGIDLSAFAMVRAVGRGGPGARLYVNVAGLVNVAVAGETGVLFARTAPGGLESIAHTLAERRGLTLEHARQWLVHVGLERPLQQVEGDPDLVATTRLVLQDGVHSVADAVRSSLEYYRMQDTAEAVDEGVLTGPATGIDGFADALSELLRLPVAPAVVARAEDGPVDPELGRVAVAAGLALHERDLSAH